MSIGLLHLLRGIHFLGGVFWVGGALLNTLFVVPTARALGPAGGQFVGHIVRVRRLPVWMNVAAWATILSGVWLYGWRSSWLTAGWTGTGPGIVFGVGGVLAIVAALLGLVVIGPTAGRLGRIGASLTAEAPPTPETAAEIQRLQRRMMVGSITAAALIVLATLCMAVARYT